MSSAASPVLFVDPSRALVDETFRVTVQNLPPGSAVTLHSLHRSEDKDLCLVTGPPVLGGPKHTNSCLGL
ncbi:uncharacterized protein ACO6RY_14609 [Pungitius sinensis]